WEYLAFLQTHFSITRIASAKYATVGLWGGKSKDTLLIPAFTNLHERASKLSGFCSNEWKRRVIDRWLREQGVKKSRNWIGFS
ncbi:hypothetical protein, partial [Enterococcus faecium]|uniref:hypothetical protein n=1 Tax=Enterococcus faecium TaxID=1352 RepID=UPI003DA1645D